MVKKQTLVESKMVPLLRLKTLHREQARLAFQRLPEPQQLAAFTGSMQMAD